VCVLIEAILKKQAEFSEQQYADGDVETSVNEQNESTRVTDAAAAAEPEDSSSEINVIEHSVSCHALFVMYASCHVSGTVCQLTYMTYGSLKCGLKMFWS